MLFGGTGTATGNNNTKQPIEVGKTVVPPVSTGQTGSQKTDIPSLAPAATSGIFGGAAASTGNKTLLSGTFGAAQGTEKPSTTTTNTAQGGGGGGGD